MHAMLLEVSQHLVPLMDADVRILHQFGMLLAGMDGTKQAFCIIYKFFPPVKVRMHKTLPGTSMVLE